ncbi:DUF4382 domain-containing protein [Simiduia sp. 21SJ11W-1]|uniref:DUF4382 domain-containing protein n=1 Tax=Simiduia sp. 21SJ11W-1 TaxID=2909669 RepID=UPI0020A1C299|nr:DUF4382 domain-containing protein [Simiduia sp. 21SJ11W-1]UTA48169.1 DUF4382 domain-containing protein [Simiduia sp. 21SJ11W-1]
MRYLSNGFLITLLATCGLLAACGGSSSDDDKATLNLAIVDGPVDAADAVVIAFTELELKPANGSSVVVTLDEAATLNLLDYQGEVSAPLVSDLELDAGEYNWVRLGVDAAASYIEIDGAQYPLEIPSAAQTGLKLNRGFTLAAGGITDFTIEFDLRKSVHQEGTGDYKLRPTLRMVNNLEVGTVVGTVSRALIEDVACENNGDNNDMGNVVYVYQGADVTPMDIQGAETDPITSATVMYEESSDSFVFTVGFLAAGDYTLAFTCDGLIDDALTADEIMFGATANAAITANAATPIALQ